MATPTIECLLAISRAYFGLQETHSKPSRASEHRDAPHAAGKSEVVLVFNERQLIDSESFQRGYRRQDGHPLARGYYIVSWPFGHGPRLYDERAVFNGPFQEKEEAETCIRMFHALLAPIHLSPRYRRPPSQASLPWQREKTPQTRDRNQQNKILALHQH